MTQDDNFIAELDCHAEAASSTVDQPNLAQASVKAETFPRKEAPSERGQTHSSLVSHTIGEPGKVFWTKFKVLIIFAPGIAWNRNIKVHLFLQRSWDPTFNATKASSSRCSSCRCSSSRQHGVAAAPGEFLLIEEVKDESPTVRSCLSKAGMCQGIWFLHHHWIIAH